MKKQQQESNGNQRKCEAFSVSYENLLKRSHLRVKGAMKLIKSERQKKRVT